MSSELIRKRVLERRKGLSFEAVKELSDRIVNRFVQLGGVGGPKWKGAGVALYRALPSEVDVRPLESILERCGARLFFPRINDRDAKSIVFAEVPHPSHDPAHWDIGPYGIQEPHSDYPPVDPDQLKIILVPGVAFGLRGERIGMGAGYYDRFLSSSTTPAIRVALAFDFQLLPELEQNPWDQPVDWIITESREVRLSKVEASLAHLR